MNIFRGQRRLFICMAMSASMMTLSGFISVDEAMSQDAELESISSGSSSALASGQPSTLDITVIGTVLAGDGKDMATILDRKTNGSGLYRLGETVDGATIINITSDGVEFEKDGRLIAVGLKHDDGPATGTQYSAAGGQPVHAQDAVLSSATNDNRGAGLFDDGAIAASQPPLDPFFIARGPGAESDEPQMELPYFEPVVNETGPEASNDEASDKPQKELPQFEPVVNYTGPVLKGKKLSRELPQFEPTTETTGPADNGSASAPLN